MRLALLQELYIYPTGQDLLNMLLGLAALAGIAVVVLVVLFVYLSLRLIQAAGARRRAAVVALAVMLALLLAMVGWAAVAAYLRLQPFLR
jgi:hypothetical protein